MCGQGQRQEFAVGRECVRKMYLISVAEGSCCCTIDLISALSVHRALSSEEFEFSTYMQVA